MLYLKRKLYLASSSKSRQCLLDQIKINYQVISQSYDETSCSWDLPIDKLVLQLAVSKMDHVIMPLDTKENIAYVLTADTLSEDMHRNIYGKPKDYQDAIEQIKALREGSYVYSGFCLDKKEYKDNNWKLIDRHTQVVSSKCVFDIPDQWIDVYLKNTIALKTAGSIVTDDFGAQFLKYISGSYSAIIGLSLLELRQALEKLGFYKQD